MLTMELIIGQCILREIFMCWMLYNENDKADMEKKDNDRESDR